MKKALFALSSLIFAYAQGYVTTVGGEDVRVSCTIITDIAVVSKDGITYFPNGDWDGGDAPMDRIIEANGYAFLTTRFTDVEEAALKWGKTAESMWNVYSQNLNTLIDPGAKRLTASNLGAVAYAMSYNNNAIQRKFGVKLSLISEAIEKMQTDDSKETTEKYDKVSSAQSELSNRLKLLSNQYDARLNDAVNEAKQASASVVSVQTQLADVQRRMNELSATKPPDYSVQFARLQAEFNAKLEQSAQASLVAGLTKVAENHVRQLLSTSIPSGFPIPAQVTTYSNQMARLNKYLGYDGDTDGDSGEKVDNNNGTFREPEKRGGGAASDVNDYLSSWGVLGFKRAGDEESPYAGFSEVEGGNGKTNVAASFSAPVNWADGKTIIVTNGCFAMRSTSAWAYYDGAFHNCEVRIGSSTSISESEIQYGTAGSVYAVITYGGNGDASLTLLPTPDNEFGVKISVKVGELVQNESVEAGDAGLRNTYQYDGSIIINCYE